MGHLQFGIETEILLTPLEPGDLDNNRLKDFAQYLVDKYEEYIDLEKLPWPKMENGCEYKEGKEADDARREAEQEKMKLDAIVELHNAKEGVKDAEKKVEDAKKKLEDTTEKIADMQKVVDAEKKVEETKKRHEEANENEEAKEEFESAEGELENLKALIKAKNDLEVAKNKVQEMKKEVKDRKKEVEKKEMEVQETEKEVSKAKTNLNVANMEVLVAKKKVAEKKFDIATKRYNDALEADDPELEELTTACDHASEELKAAKLEVEDAEWVEEEISNRKKGYDVSKWALTADSSIKPDNENQCQLYFFCFFFKKKFLLLTLIDAVGIELISPILRFNESRFRDLVRGVWHRLHASCSIQTNETCGTHVHVSPSNGFHVRDAKAVARAILFFEPAIDALVPRHRREGTYCKRFYVSHPVFSKLLPEQAIALVDNVSEVSQEIKRASSRHSYYFDEIFAHPIAQLMNPGNDREYTWNFTSITRTTTIEFRQGPGVTTADETLAWVEFVVTFVNAALKLEHYKYKELNERFTPAVDGLKSFLNVGIVSGISHQSFLDRLTSAARAVED